MDGLDLVGTKLLLLVGTAALGVHPRLRLIPNLRDDNLSGLTWHLRGISALAIKPPLRWPRSPPY